MADRSLTVAVLIACADVPGVRSFLEFEKQCAAGAAHWERQVMFRKMFSLVVVASLPFALEARADTIEVGSGANQASLLVNFGDGAVYTFGVLFNGTTTGIGLFDLIEAETSLTTVRQTFGSDTFIDGISFDGHSNIGFGGGENWWHYWTMDTPPTWDVSFISASSRVIEDGDSDGWVYGNANAPVPEPSAVLLLAGGAVLMLRRRSVSVA